jgi:large conductance mechanosensitive channel
VLSDFKNFLMRGNIVELAVAVVIGAAFSALVASLVADLLTPLIAAIVGKPDFSALKFTINSSEFTYGKFINALITFVSVSAAVFFFVVKPMSALEARSSDSEDETAPDEVQLLTEIRDALIARS